MSMTKHSYHNDPWVFTNLEELVPQDHLVRKMDRCMDWKFIYPLIDNLYSDIGRPSIDPVVLFKMIILNIAFGYNSMRRTCREIEVNVAYRWYLGLSLNGKVPNYSTWSQNYIRRFKDSSIFDEIFTKILEQAIRRGFVDMSSVFGDSTHQKASANKNRYEDEEIEIVKRHYDDELLEEINAVRKEKGKKPIKEIKKSEIVFDEETGEEKEVEKKKHVKKSKTDPDAGLFHKGEKQKCYAYSQHVFSDKNGFVIHANTFPGNLHDSTIFFKAYDELISKHGEYIDYICLDAGYKSPAICREIIKRGKEPVLPYKRPMTKKGFFKKYEFQYVEDFDYYVCPNNEVLKFSTVTRDGYRQYKSDHKKCEYCPFLDKCTKSKNHQKIISRHVWEDYLERAEEIRHSDTFKEIYPKRKETVERIFAEDKENHNLRFTRLRGLEKNRKQGLMIFSVHNFLKIARWSWKGV